MSFFPSTNMNELATLAFYVMPAMSLLVGLIGYNFLCKIYRAAAYILTEHLTISMQIHTELGMAANVTNWLESFVENNCGAKMGHLNIGKDIAASKTGKDEDSFDLRKKVGPIQINRSVFFFYKKTLIRITRKTNASGSRMFGSLLETFTITAYGTRNKQLLIDLMNEGRKLNEKRPSKHIYYFKSDFKGNWRRPVLFRPRALSTITLKEGVTDAIQNDLREFLESEEWYKDRGIPYRRGYLLYGPPGCGKTSFVKAIAGQIGYNIYEMQLSKLDDDSLNNLMSTFSRKSILLFEDADAVFSARTQDEERSDTKDGISGKLNIRESKSKITFSALLNAVDGVASTEGYVIFMTTNRLEKLDAALIRPGRIDMRQFIDHPDEQQIAVFFQKFYPGCDEDVAKKFAKAVDKLNFNPSVAQIQGLFLRHKNVPEDNLLDVDSLIEVCKDNADLGVRHIYL